MESMSSFSSAVMLRVPSLNPKRLRGVSSSFVVFDAAP